VEFRTAGWKEDDWCIECCWKINNIWYYIVVVFFVGQLGLILFTNMALGVVCKRSMGGGGKWREKVFD
jgi:hypothetical protein